MPYEDYSTLKYEDVRGGDEDLFIPDYGS